MPNRYLPAALVDLIEEHEQQLLVERNQGKGDDRDEYIPEWKVLEDMLKPEFQRKFRERRGEDVDG